MPESKMERIKDRALQIVQESGGRIVAIDLFIKLVQMSNDDVDPYLLCKDCGYHPNDIIRLNTKH